MENSIFVNRFFTGYRCPIFGYSQILPYLCHCKKLPSSPAPSVPRIPRIRPPIPPLPSNEKFSNTKTQRHKESRKKIKTKIYANTTKILMSDF